MEVKLHFLRWRPRWVSRLGVTDACATYLKQSHLGGWLFGASGHAFIINMAEDVDCSGVTAFNPEPMRKLTCNLGLEIECIAAKKGDPDFADKQRAAYEMVKRTLDAAAPCYGWGLLQPEYYNIHGYDETGYFITGPQAPAGVGPQPWQNAGADEIGRLEICAVRAATPPDDRATVRQGIEYALAFNEGDPNLTCKGYAQGLAAYDRWIEALEKNSADGVGMAYNAAAWNECRYCAVYFLKEAKERIGGGSEFDEAVRHYTIAWQNLWEVVGLFHYEPLGHEIHEADLRAKAVEHLRKARAAEEPGMAALKQIVSRL